MPMLKRLQLLLLPMVFALACSGTEDLSLTVLPSSARLSPGQAMTLTATLTHGNGTKDVVTAKATWTTEKPDVASVSEQGVLTGVNPGKSTITATYKGISSAMVVTVTEPELWRIVVEPKDP